MPRHARTDTYSNGAQYSGRQKFVCGTYDLPVPALESRDDGVSTPFDVQFECLSSDGKAVGRFYRYFDRVVGMESVEARFDFDLKTI